MRARTVRDGGRTVGAGGGETWPGTSPPPKRSGCAGWPGRGSRVGAGQERRGLSEVRSLLRPRHTPHSLAQPEARGRGARTF